MFKCTACSSHSAMVITVSASSETESLCKKLADQHGTQTSDFRLQPIHKCAMEAVCRMCYSKQWSAILCTCVGIINIPLTTTQYFLLFNIEYNTFWRVWPSSGITIIKYLYEGQVEQ